MTLATGGAGQIALDATNVYWSTGSAVMKLALNGATPAVTLFEADLEWFAVDGTGVYGFTSASGSTGYNFIKTSLTGGTVTTIASALPTEEVSGPMYADGTNLYFILEAESSIGLNQMPSGGGTMTTLTGESPISFAVDASSVYWAGRGRSGGPCICKTPIGGGTVTTLATPSLPDPASLFHTTAIDASNVYWIDTGGLLRVSKSGATPVTLSASTSLSSMAVDGSGIYGTSQAAVVKISLSGGAPATLATGQTPADIATDSTTVYWTDSKAGTVMKLAK